LLVLKIKITKHIYKHTLFLKNQLQKNEQLVLKETGKHMKQMKQFPISVLMAFLK